MGAAQGGFALSESGDTSGLGRGATSCVCVCVYAFAFAFACVEQRVAGESHQISDGVPQRADRVQIPDSRRRRAIGEMVSCGVDGGRAASRCRATDCDGTKRKTGTRTNSNSNERWEEGADVTGPADALVMQV